VEAAGEAEVVLRQASGDVRALRQGDLVPPDRDVRVVVLLLGDLRHPVDERHRLLEVLERHGLDDRVLGALPARGRRQLAVDGVAVQPVHLAPPYVRSVTSQLCCPLWPTSCGSTRSGGASPGSSPARTTSTPASAGCTPPRSPTSPTCYAAASSCSPPA